MTGVGIRAEVDGAATRLVEWLATARLVGWLVTAGLVGWLATAGLVGWRVTARLVEWACHRSAPARLLAADCLADLSLPHRRRQVRPRRGDDRIATRVANPACLESLTAERDVLLTELTSSPN